MLSLRIAVSTITYPSSFCCQTLEPLQTIYYGLIQAVTDEILVSYRTQKFDDWKRPAVHAVARASDSKPLVHALFVKVPTQALWENPFPQERR